MQKVEHNRINVKIYEIANRIHPSTDNTNMSGA